MKRTASASSSLNSQTHISQIVVDQKTGASAELLDIERGGKVMLLARFLKSAEQKSRLSRRERLRIIEQTLLLLEMNYVHLPLKQAMHAKIGRASCRER